jgi:hypothetical protein
LVGYNCWKTIEIGVPYIDPSEKCIRVVKRSDMVCICRVITLDDEMQISVAKILRLAEECNKPIPAV